MHVCALHICWLGGWLIGRRDLLHKKGLQHISNIWFMLLEESQYISNFLLMREYEGGNNTYWFQLVIGRVLMTCVRANFIFFIFILY